MRIAELRARWEGRRDEWQRLGVHVDGAALAGEVLADLDALDRSDRADVVTLRRAHELGGYSEDHLSRLVRNGKIENMGQRGSPRIRLSDVPRRPGYLPPDPDPDQLAERRRIVASVTKSAGT